MLLNNATLNALNTTINTSYQRGYSRLPPWWNKIAMRVPISTPLATYAWMARLGKMRQWLGERQVQNLGSYVYQLLSQPYEFTLGVLRDDIKYNNLGVYTPMFELMGEVSAKWPDQMTRAALQAGTSQITFDGVAFFSASHVIGSLAAQSNLFASMALNAANFDTGRIALSQYKGEDGELLNAGRQTLIVPSALEKTGRDIISAGILASGATNTLQGMADLLVLDELNNEPTVWYLGYLDGAIKPLVTQILEEPTQVRKDRPEDDNNFWKRELIWGTEAHGAAGYGLWWKIARFSP